MVRSRFFCALALVFGGFALAGCGAGNGGGGRSCPDGEPGCRCYGNGTCNPGLTCSSTGICGGSSAGNVPSGGTTPGAGGAPAPGGTSPGAGSASASGGTGSGGTSGNLVDTCNDFVTCWWSNEGYPQVDPNDRLHRSGASCQFSDPNNTWQLGADGTVDVDTTWSIDANGDLQLCDKKEPGYCWMTCNTSGYINFPCTGLPADCSAVPASVCTSVQGCVLSDGSCELYAEGCRDFWTQDACKQQGCTWNP